MAKTIGSIGFFIYLFIFIFLWLLCNCVMWKLKSTKQIHKYKKRKKERKGKGINERTVEMQRADFGLPDRQRDVFWQMGLACNVLYFSLFLCLEKSKKLQ